MATIINGDTGVSQVQPNIALSAPTLPVGTNTTQVATTALVKGASKVLTISEFVAPSTSDTYTLIADGVLFDTPISITYTPKSLTSRLIIDVDCECRTIAALGMGMGIKRDGVKIVGSFNLNTQSFVYKGDSINHHWQTRFSASVPTNSLSPTTFLVWYQPLSGSGEYSTGWVRNAIRVMEVEA